jgi:hypothetical protein
MATTQLVDARGNPPGSIYTTTATIADTASLSGAVDLGPGQTLVGIESAAGWTTAVLSFQVSLDNVTFVEYFNSSGVAVSTPGSLAASQRMGLDPSDFLSVRYLKVRSGTSGAAVAQSGGDVLTLVTRSL